MQLRDSINYDCARPCTPNLGSHCNAEVCQINNFWLACSIFNYGFALCKGSRHHQVLCGSYTSNIQVNLRTFQPTASARNISMTYPMLNLHFGSHCLQSSDMQVNWSCSNCTTTW